MINAVNIITAFRIAFSAALLFCPVFSPMFYILYLAAGITDMIDGTVARKTNTVSKFGEKLDSSADMIFVLVCFIKLIPVLDISLWLYIWITVIVFIRIVNIISGLVIYKRFVILHTTMNKLTGALLFMLPLTLQFVGLPYSAAIVCCFATFAAVQEGYYLKDHPRTCGEKLKFWGGLKW